MENVMTFFTESNIEILAFAEPAPAYEKPEKCGSHIEARSPDLTGNSPDLNPSSPDLSRNSPDLTANSPDLKPSSPYLNYLLLSLYSHRIAS